MSRLQAAKDISKDDSFKFEENPTTSVVNDTEGPLLASSEEELVKVGTCCYSVLQCLVDIQIPI